MTPRAAGGRSTLRPPHARQEPRSGDRLPGYNASGVYGSNPPTDFEALVETITQILSNWTQPEGRDKIEAIVTARRKSLVHVLSVAIEAEDFADLQWLSDRLVTIE